MRVNSGSLAILAAMRCASSHQGQAETKRSLERAIRSWAAEDKDVAAVVPAGVAYIAKMLVAAGVERRRALPRAAFLYWAYLGQPIVMDPSHASIPASALDEHQRPVRKVSVHFRKRSFSTDCRVAPLHYWRWATRKKAARWDTDLHQLK